MAKRKHDMILSEVPAVETADATDEKVRRWQDYWGQLQAATDDSEEKLDGKIFAISTAGIGLLLGTMGIGHESLTDGVWSAIVSLAAFTVALTLNLLYYRLTIRQHNKQFGRIKQYIEHPTGNDEPLVAMIEKGNARDDAVSWISICSVIAGIVFFGIYIVTNII